VDRWKYFDITHREHVRCNPMSVEKLEERIALLRLASDAHILDIATGKGEFLIRPAEQYRIEGVGIDLSLYCVSDAEEKHGRRMPGAQLTFKEMNGADYQPERPESFDLVACIGASWIYGGHAGTLEALNEMAAPGSWVVVGEPFWRQELAAEYLEGLGVERNAFGTHHENAEAGQKIAARSLSDFRLDELGNFCISPDMITWEYG
jgi:SAM-dependent methyltransferase